MINPKKPYNHSVRKFALVLSCKSKSVYKWIRSRFPRRFPAIRTVRQWHSNSHSNFQDGFNPQTIMSLTKLSNEKKLEGKELYVSMCYDEVSIRKHIQWVHARKQFSGIVTYGRRDGDETPVANNAIFFLLNLVESGQSLILGCFLIKYLDTIEKSELIKDVIAKINSTGAYLMSIAFDGLRTNFSTCEALGASFDLQNLQPFIINPKNNSKIAIVLDPPHMLKLIRNCLAAKGNLKDDHNNVISWSYFEKLVLQKSNLASHKMTRKHINFQSNKMNVKLAAQTFSLSVAKSMEALFRSNDLNFRNAVGTIVFVKNINKIFDIFNSKHLDSNNLFKRGLNVDNSDKIFEFLNYMDNYLRSIKLNGQNVLETNRKTGFLGFLMNIVVIRFFYHEYVLPQKLKTIFFFYFGQDMLEALFSRVRAMCGSNSNPTTEQLLGILRQLVTYNELKSSEDASCQDHLNILSVSSLKILPKNPQNPQVETFDENQNIILNINLNFRDIYTIKIRAGTIEKKIRYGTHRCSHCANIFSDNFEKIEGIFLDTALAQRPTKSTVKICEIIYKLFKIHSDIYNFDYSKLYSQIINLIPYQNLYEHVDFSHDSQHKSEYILLIIDEYIRIHATYSARMANIQIHAKIIGKTAQKLKHVVGQ